LRTSRARGKSRNISKTERIANVFTSRPLDSISPKEISMELGLEIQLVTSIVSRLKAEGLIERVGWGKYKLRMEQTVDDEILKIVAQEMFEMSQKVIRTKHEGDVEEELKDPFKFLVQIYREIVKVGGEMMANNLLRLSARKRMEEEEVDFLVFSIREVVHQ
jgi:hypothetical protein